VWVELTIVGTNGKLSTVPVNMHTITTFSTCKDPAYPKANSVLFPNGGILEYIPVTETFNQLKELIK